jgi:hypothetical protein
MFIKSARLTFAIAIALSAVGCGQNQSAPPQAGAAPAVVAPPVIAATTSPDGTVLASVKALRANNIAALLDNALPAGEVTQLKADWSKNMNKDPVTDEDRKKFAEQITKLTAPGAEDKIYAEIEPQLKQFDAQSAQQMPMMIAMGQGFAQSAIQQNKDLNDSQKQQAVAIVEATGKWAQSVKFTDPVLVKQAIAAVCKTARDLNLKTIDEARALTYDQAMQKAGIVVAGLKQVLGVYGLNMDKALDSVKTETVSTTADAAKVKVTYTAFDQPFTTESDLTRVDGKWYSKQAIEQWNKKQHEEATAGNPNAQTPNAAK